MPDSEKPTLLLIDGHSLAFRAFYALPIDSFVTRDGQHTNAIHGFLSMLILLLQKEKPTHLGVAFDISRFSFRNREYAEYKGTRNETPPEFKGQVPLLEEALHAMNIATITKEDFEADDILATLSLQGKEQGYRVLVVSGDRDTIQLVDDDVTLLYPNARGVSELKVYDRDAVRERYGIEPQQYPEIAALVGETSDNLPGVDKVGEKTAVKWIQQYGTAAELLAHADEITGVVGNNLREQQDRVVRNRKLNRLVRDVELPVAPGRSRAQPDRRECGARGLRAAAVPHAARSGDQARGNGRRPGGGGRRQAARGIHPRRSHPGRRRAGEVAGCRIGQAHGPARAAGRHPQRADRGIRHREPHRERVGAVGAGPPRLRGARAVARLRARPSTCTTPSASSSRSPAPVSSSTGSPSTPASAPGCCDPARRPTASAV